MARRPTAQVGSRVALPGAVDLFLCRQLPPIRPAPLHTPDFGPIFLSAGVPDRGRVWHHLPGPLTISLGHPFSTGMCGEGASDRKCRVDETRTSCVHSEERPAGNFTTTGGLCQVSGCPKSVTGRKEHAQFCGGTVPTSASTQHSGVLRVALDTGFCARPRSIRHGIWIAIHTILARDHDSTSGVFSRMCDKRERTFRSLQKECGG